MDELGIGRDAPNMYTIEKKGAKTVALKGTGSEKEHYTIALTVSLTGKRFPLLLILPGKGKKKLGINIPDNVYVEYRDKSWMDTNIMKKWITHIIKPRQRKLQEGKRGLILLDRFRAHTDEDVEKELKACSFDVMFLPANTTSKLQPLDLGVNFPFKSRYSALWEAWLERKSEEDFTKPAKETVLTWLSDAWASIPSEIVVNSWKTYTDMWQDRVNALATFDTNQSVVHRNFPILLIEL